ncbi:MAG: alpha/beta hydrolase [Pseudomonadota bacterium]
MSFDRPFQIASPTGAQLNTRLQNPAGAPRAIVHINHGLAEHSARYATFANALSASGYAVIAHDHRGHGQTKAPDGPRGVFAANGQGVRLVLADCVAVQDFARAEFRDVPVIMFGHSMGGLITMNYTLHYPDRLVGAAVWNSNFDGGLLGRTAQLILAIEKMRLGSDVPSRMLPKLTFQDWAKKIRERRTDFDWLSRIPEQVDAYIEDPDCGWDASVSMWQDVFRLIFDGGDISFARSATKALPFLLLGGGADPATFNGTAVEKHAARMRNAGFENVQMTVYPKARHETLNDLDAAQATQDFIKWADAL